MIIVSDLLVLHKWSEVALLLLVQQPLVSYIGHVIPLIPSCTSLFTIYKAQPGPFSLSTKISAGFSM